jgi:hypothetical protein
MSMMDSSQELNIEPHFEHYNVDWKVFPSDYYHHKPNLNTCTEGQWGDKEVEYSARKKELTAASEPSPVIRNEATKSSHTKHSINWRDKKEKKWSWVQMQQNEKKHSAK